MNAPAPHRRWFAALPVLGDLACTAAALPRALQAMSSLDLHVTIAFFGAVEEAAARAGFAALVLDLEARELALGAVEPMGEGDRWTALAVQVRDDALAAAMGAARDAALEAAGARRERRAPRPHITVARLQRRAKASDRAAALAWAGACDCSTARVQVREVALYVGRGHVAADGSRYEIVDRRALARV